MATLADLALDSPRPAASAGAVWRLPAALILAGVGLFALSMWLFWDGLTQMWGWWLDLPEYSYALLIPPVSGFLIWQQKDRLEQISFAGSWWGAGVVLLGGGMLLLGQLGTVYTLVQYAYVVTLLGLAL